MSEPNGPDEPPVDYLAPFETFQGYALRRGTMYRGRIRPEFAQDRDELRRILDTAPGTYTIEEIDGRVYANVRTYRGPRPRRRLWLHITLLALAAVTTTAAGVEFARRSHRLWTLTPFNFVIDSVTHVVAGAGDEVAKRIWPEFVAAIRTGISYSAALLFVLLAHEMGHYIAARRYGVDATLPFLLPVPILFGTFGAIIKMRSPITHRRALFDIGVAGPLAGLVASLIVCVIGLKLSGYVPEHGSFAGLPFRLRHSLAFGWLVRAVLGPGPAMSYVRLHPVAIAGWFGMFMTFLNLMPLGQLDGGHVCYALLGSRQRYVGWGAFGLLAGMGFVFPGWLVLAVLVLLVLRVKHPPVMDESIRLGAWRTVLGIAVILIFFLLFIPRPIDPVVYGG